ncbi:MAG TPA: hypothetical protein VF581_07085 [Flavobacterium sp.]|jgi:hypothetical protein
MGAINNGNPGNSDHGSQQHNDNRKNYAHSNERRRDNIRDNTRDHEYKEFDETLTNDENYNLYNDKIKGDPDFSDKNQNAHRDKANDDAP